MKNGGCIFQEQNRFRRFVLLKIGHPLSLETSVPNYPATLIHIAEESVGCLYRRENLKPSVSA
jgi:hypothetical protein